MTFLNLQQQSQRCCRLQRFSKYNKIFLPIFKTHWATRGDIKIYNAGIVTRDRRIGSWV
jgi:hypothetical protein